MERWKRKALLPELRTSIEGGEPSKKWESLIKSVQIKSFKNFKSKVIELIQEIMGNDVYKDQTKYLVDTPQPTGADLPQIRSQGDARTRYH